MADQPVSAEVEARTWDCVKEVQRRFAADGTEITQVWHVARSKGRSQDFCPIRCSNDEGIVLHGGIVRRWPTCPDCIALVASQPDGQDRQEGRPSPRP